MPLIILFSGGGDVTLEIVYDIQMRPDLGVSYDLQTAVSPILGLSYDLRAAADVEASLSLIYDLLAAPGSAGSGIVFAQYEYDATHTI